MPGFSRCDRGLSTNGFSRKIATRPLNEPGDLLRSIVYEGGIQKENVRESYDPTSHEYGGTSHDPRNVKYDTLCSCKMPPYNTKRFERRATVTVKEQRNSVCNSSFGGSTSVMWKGLGCECFFPFNEGLRWSINSSSQRLEPVPGPKLNENCWVP